MTTEKLTATGLSNIAKEYGIFGAMVCFFIYWSYAREGALNARVDAQNEFIRNTLVVSLDRSSTAIEGFRMALENRQEVAKK